MSDMPEIIEQNTGLIIQPPEETAYIFGAETPVAHLVQNPTRNWLPWMSKGERQAGTYYDVFACVSFSEANTVEAIFNYLVQTSKIGLDNLDWLKANGYFDQDGKMNVSDRFVAKMSGTDPDKGNSAQKVWDTVRHCGLVPETMWGWNRGKDVPQDQKFVEWYYQEIPEEVKAKGLEFKNRFDIRYEVVDILDEDKRIQALVHSPIQVFIPAGCPKIDDIQQFCSREVNHAVTMPQNHDTTCYQLFDHYTGGASDDQANFIRKVSLDYPFYRYGYIGTITEKQSIANVVSPMIKDLSNDFLATSASPSIPHFADYFREKTGRVISEDEKLAYAYYRKLFRQK